MCISRYNVYHTYLSKICIRAHAHETENRVKMPHDEYITKSLPKSKISPFLNFNIIKWENVGDEGLFRTHVTL